MSKPTNSIILKSKILKILYSPKFDRTGVTGNMSTQLSNRLPEYTPRQISGAYHELHEDGIVGITRNGIVEVQEIPYQLAAAWTLPDIDEFEITPEKLDQVEVMEMLIYSVSIMAEVTKKWVFHGHDFDHDAFDSAREAVDECITMLDARPDDRPFDARINHAKQLMPLFGLVGEINEWRDNDNENGEELGDINWYLNAEATLSGLDMQAIEQANISKLQKRYKDGFSQEASQNREEYQQIYPNDGDVVQIEIESAWETGIYTNEKGGRFFTSKYDGQRYVWPEYGEWRQKTGQSIT